MCRRCSLSQAVRCALGADVVTISSLTLRVEWDGKPIVFSAAELVLQGPGGTKAVPLFENSSRWRAAAGVTVAQVGLFYSRAILPGTNERVCSADDGAASGRAQRAGAGVVAALGQGRSGGGAVHDDRCEPELRLQAVHGAPHRLAPLAQRATLPPSIRSTASERHLLTRVLSSGCVWPLTG